MDSLSLNSGMALAFGAFHVLEPGHGKTALLAYISSDKRNWKDSVIISLSSALTHSLAVFFIAFVTHYLTHHTSLENKISYIGSFLSMASGVLICCIGFWFIFLASKKNTAKGCCSCASHKKNEKSSIWKSGLFTSGVLGMATGILPCPTIVVAYIAGLSSGNSLLGIQNVVLFSIGMFLSLFCFINFWSYGSSKIIGRFETVNINIKWSLLQGIVFIAMGLGIAFYPL